MRNAPAINGHIISSLPLPIYGQFLGALPKEI
jgi:hypothetical protein